MSFEEKCLFEKMVFEELTQAPEKSFKTAMEPLKSARMSRIVNFLACYKKRSKSDVDADVALTEFLKIRILLFL